MTNCTRVWMDRFKYIHHGDDFADDRTTCDLPVVSSNPLFRVTRDLRLTDCPRCQEEIQSMGHMFYCMEPECFEMFETEDSLELHGYSH